MRSPLKDIILRGEDSTGNGWYGASRGSRKHKGVDYIGEVGDPVYACISGKVRIGNVYDIKKYPKRSHFKLIELKGDVYRTKEMYVKPVVKTGEYAFEGDIIGYLQGIGEYYGNGMPNHCHVSVWKNGLLTDPEPIILTT